MASMGGVRDPGHRAAVARVRSIVVALDLESGGDRALPVARSLAEQGGIPVELLTVSSPNVSEDIDTYELNRRHATTAGRTPCARSSTTTTRPEESSITSTGATAGCS
jgi:hypothetical protein